MAAEINRATRRKAAQADAREQESKAIVAADDVVTQTLTLTGTDGVTYTLTDDVPTHRLLYATRLLQLAQQEQSALAAGDFDAFDAAAEQLERERVNVATLLVRHSHPDLTRDDVARLFPAALREALIAHFFTARLIPFFTRRDVSEVLARGIDASAPTSTASTDAPPV